MLGRNKAFLGVLAITLALQGCAPPPPGTASLNQNPTVGPTAAPDQPGPTAIAPSPTTAQPAVATMSPIPITRIPNLPSPAPTAAGGASTPSTMPSPTEPAVAGAGVSPAQLTAVAIAQAELTKRTGLAASAIVVDSVSSVEWPDSSLGCPKPDTMYSQIVTPGYRIVLTAGGQTYEYHTGRGNNITLCSPASAP